MPIPPPSDSNSSDSSDLDEEPEKVARRQRAIQLLAQAFNKNKPVEAAEAADEEVRFLEHLQSLSAADASRSIADRLSVMAVRRGGVRLQAKSDDAPIADEEPEPPSQQTGRSECELQSLLAQVSAGDTSGVSAMVLEPAYWARLLQADARQEVAPSARGEMLVRPEHFAWPSLLLGVAAGVAVSRGQGAGGRASIAVIMGGAGLVLASFAATAANAAARALSTRRASRSPELRIPHADVGRMRQSLHDRGYGSLKPGDTWQWHEARALLGGLRDAAATVRAAGYPPAFVFMLDSAWEVLDRLWEPLTALLGDGCTMDPSVFCWIAAAPEALPHGPRASAGTTAAAASPPPRSVPTTKRAGANFGIPHRDFTCLQSQRKEDGTPAMLSVWLPLTAVDAENGCMMVVPQRAKWSFCEGRLSDC